MRRTAVFVTAAIVALVWCPRIHAVDPAPPNILFIMSDDHPWSFYGKMESLSEESPPGSSHPLTHPNFPLPTDFATPGLDELANRGAFFPVGHAAAAFCHPSFQASLTGLYEKDFLAGRFNRPAGVAPYYIIEYLNEALHQHHLVKSEGPPVVEFKYRSLGFGKIWTEGSFRNAGFDFGWEGKGEARGTITPILEFIKANTGVPQDAYDTFCNLPRSQCPEDSAKPEPTQPWFVWYAPNLPHYPKDAKARTRKRVLQPAKCKPGVVTNCVEVPETDPGGTALSAVFGRMEDLENPDVDGGHINYLANVMLLDYWVGQLLEYVNEHAPNTLIVYQADNGYIFPKSKKANGDNAFRTPMMVSWPDHIGSGVVRDDLVSALDFIPTLVDYATGHTFLQCAPGTPLVGEHQDHSKYFLAGSPKTGCTAGQEATCGCFEGQSMRPFIEGTSQGRDWLIGMMSDDGSYLRTKNGWRLTRSPNCKFKLFDLVADLDEKHNCFDNSSDPCRGVDFTALDYAADGCSLSNPNCTLVKQWECALKTWRNPDNKCTFSCP